MNRMSIKFGTLRDMTTPLLAVVMFLGGMVQAAEAEPGMQVVRQRLVEIYVSTDLKIDGDATELRQSQRDDGTWDDINYQDTSRAKWDSYKQVGRAMLMGQAFRESGGKEENLAVGARKALAWWSRHELRSSNWWWNQIGVPQATGITCLLLGDALPEDERRAIMPVVRRHVTQRTGQNLLWALGQQVMYSLLDESEAELRDAYEQIARLLVAKPLGKEGILGDASFHQHGKTLYSGGYGFSFVCDASLLVAAADGTEFAVPQRNRDQLVALLLDGTRWMVYGTVFDYGACGRVISRRVPDEPTKRLRKPGTLPGLGLADVYRVMAGVESARESEFERTAERMRGGPREELGSRAFPMSDLLVEHHPEFYASVRMLSERLWNTDGACNSEGLKSRYIADGCTFLMRSGNEYHNIFPCWDWKRIPGTTVCRTGLVLTPKNLRSTGTRGFVGGLSDGIRGFAAMDFERDELTARKTWFMQPDGMLAIGAGITCSDEHPVETIVNQCILEGDVIFARDGDQARLTPGLHALETPCTVSHAGLDYVFTQQSGHLVAEIRPAVAGDWTTINRGKFKQPTPETKGIFCLRLEHGAAPTAATYSYRVTPSGKPKRTPTDDIRVLAHGPELTAAARSGDDAVLQLAFFAPGRTNIQTPPLLAQGNVPLVVTVDRPCLLQLRSLGDDQRVLLSVADPTHSKGTVTVRINRCLADSGASPAENGTTEIKVPLPTGLSAGSTVSYSLSKKLPVSR